MTATSGPGDAAAPGALTVALMWEARAAAGRGAELLEWARARPTDGEPLRRETFRAGEDRVLVITWWHAPALDAALPELPDPAPGLTTRPVHRWRFESVG
ncbi:hypothetical protein [Streptomyces clavuligerus]|uniref:ABM domain-containing protein n=1 Tax=Streptomyces clavuligerus TaxID=1901 RepID=E2Q2G9_STRCL|nr:hypothetical protein [Streptomyces clavuligerus]ANW18586.1 hypothetical protein BB341_10255 [Streptomyces clavuligerus]AXU13147.1 hypothetical protein D1794_10600 [Streptomyces clavuligerus]EFG08757.1 Hypothetical protein SCLAV_3685 [Streptomyces clavuligerus]MBY6303089.1 hypothetical protein [Streptomyces clavuligerus]QCS05930.1 hypothetical protein CRV15_10030 [Streptomyces clavuligerus]